jgi:uncharacterized protein (TIGR02147 family)
MQPEEYIRNLLMMELLGLQSKNSRYSMRAYSKKVGIPQSAISEIIGKRRKVTAKMALKIMTGLTVPPETVSEVLGNFKNQISLIEPKTNSLSRKFQPLNMDQFHAISEWYHFAILSLAETKTFKSDPAWIAKRLGISKVQAMNAVSRLLRLEMLIADPKTKKLKATGIQYQIDPGVATAALKKACRENIELSSDALEATRFDERDFTAITLCFDPEKIPEAKRMIKIFRNKFSQQMESGQKKEVYKLCIQLFPLTKNGV